MPRSTRLAVALAALLLPFGLVACNDDGADVRSSGSGSGSGSGSASGASGSGSGSGSGVEAECVPRGEDIEADTEVEVALDEFSITAAPTEAAAGAVQFIIQNEGEEPHELVVVQGTEDDLDIVDGQVDEDALPEAAFIGEVEPFSGGTSCNGTFELTAGDYVLFCNIVETEEGGEVESHVEAGMLTDFSVTS